MKKYSYIFLLGLCFQLNAQNDSIKGRFDIDFVEFGWGVGARTKMPVLAGNSQIFMNSAKHDFPIFSSPGLHFYKNNKIGIGANFGFLFNGMNKKELEKESANVETDYYKQIDKRIAGPGFIFFRLMVSRNYEVKKWLRAIPYVGLFYGSENSSLYNDMGMKQRDGNIYMRREYRFNDQRMYGADLGMALKIKESVTSDEKSYAGFLVKIYVTYYSFNGVASYKDTDFEKHVLAEGSSRFSQNNFNFGISGLAYITYKKKRK